MDRIERLLARLVDEAAGYTLYWSVDAVTGAGLRRDALRSEIAADWRAMVEALESAIRIGTTATDQDDAIGQLIEWEEGAKDLLVRVKGE